MKVTQELKIFAIYLFLIVLAEAITSLLSPTYGLFMHSMLLVSLLGLSALWQKNSQSSNLFLCFSIAPLIRVFSLSLPLGYFPSYTWYLVAGIPMLAAAVTVVNLQGLVAKDIGLTFKKPLIQLAITFTGIPLGIIEYCILKPAPVTAGFTMMGVVLLAIGFIVATGFVEELVFRGVFQNNAVKAFGPKIGVLMVSIVFAALHIGWLQLLDVVFVFAVGLFFGVLALKTGSIAGVSLAHGLTNVFLFVVMPSYFLLTP
jgi:membrane protease YdiL (CAAX protease family)